MHVPEAQGGLALAPTYLYVLGTRPRLGRTVRAACRGTPSKSKYLLGTPGFEIFIWVGQGASQSEKVSAFPYAQKYLKDYKRPPVLPLTRYSEGKEPSSFLELFGPPEAQGACASCCVVS